MVGSVALLCVGCSSELTPDRVFATGRGLLSPQDSVMVPCIRPQGALRAVPSAEQSLSA